MKLWGLDSSLLYFLLGEARVRPRKTELPGQISITLSRWAGESYQSEASIQVTWSLWTNQRPVSSSLNIFWPIRGQYLTPLISFDQSEASYSPGTPAWPQTPGTAHRPSTGAWDTPPPGAGSSSRICDNIDKLDSSLSQMIYLYRWHRCSTLSMSRWSTMTGTESSNRSATWNQSEVSFQVKWSFLTNQETNIQAM